jgi:hypothetical protein
LQQLKSLQHDKFANKVVFAMTINKAQKQTVKRFGISYFLFSGQLYVALSRNSAFPNVIIAISQYCNTEGRRQLIENDKLTTSNTVYREVL